MLDNDLLKSTLALLEKKSPTTICIFDRSEFFMCIGNDAEFVASKIFRSNAFIKRLTFEGKSLPYVNINKNQYQRTIKDLLLIHQYRVEVYQNKNRNTTWDLASKASPGNLGDFEKIFADSEDAGESRAVVALKLISSGNGGKHVAIACCDLTNERFIVAEFPDDVHYNSLQAFLVQVAPKEFIMPNSERDPDYKALEPILRRFGVVTSRKPGEFSASDVIQDLNRLLEYPKGSQPNAMALPETKLIGAMGCVSVLINYLKLLADPTSFNRFKLEKALFGQYMRLDANVVRSLDLFELTGGYDSKDTLYGLLNRCRTGAGKRLLDQWIKMPLLDVNKINERLDIVASLVADTEACQTLTTILSRFPDIQRILKNFLKKRATLVDLHKLYLGAKLIPNTINAIQKLDDSCEKSIAQCLTEPLEELQRELKNLIELVVTTLDLENMKNFEIYIKPNYDEKLMNLKEQMSDLEEKMQNEASQAAKKLGLEAGKSLKLETNAQLGFHFRVTNKDEKVLRNRGIKILDSNKGGVKFRTSFLTDFNDDYCEIKKEYETFQNRIAAKVLETAATYFEPLQRLGVVMAALDVFVSFAIVSRAYVRPVVLEKGAGILELSGARHPCLETHDNLSFIPNDVYFEKGKTEFLLITGPNMGGKSTYLRQTGLIVLMAQIGCFVPCSSARLSVVDAIFTRVGASDAQLEGASTFRMEMIEMASILEAATSDSLILIDELGRGTSTYDGCALAWSIAEHIAKDVRSWCMFATHFHELTALDIDLATVENRHVTADICDGRFTLLYQVKPGPCESSFGVHIAKVLDLPKSVIEDATRVLDDFAWSARDDENVASSVEEVMEFEQEQSSKTKKTLHDSSAASFVAQIQRIVKNDRIYASLDEKARELRNLLTSTNTNEGDSATVPFE